MSTEPLQDRPARKTWGQACTCDPRGERTYCVCRVVHNPATFGHLGPSRYWACVARAAERAATP